MTIFKVPRKVVGILLLEIGFRVVKYSKGLLFWLERPHRVPKEVNLPQNINSYFLDVLPLVILYIPIIYSYTKVKLLGSTVPYPLSYKC